MFESDYNILIQFNENSLKPPFFSQLLERSRLWARGGIIPFAQVESKLLTLLNKKVNKIVITA